MLLEVGKDFLAVGMFGVGLWYVYEAMRWAGALMDMLMGRSVDSNSAEED